MIERYAAFSLLHLCRVFRQSQRLESFRGLFGIQVFRLGGIYFVILVIVIAITFSVSLAYIMPRFLPSLLLQHFKFLILSMACFST